MSEKTKSFYAELLEILCFATGSVYPNERHFRKLAISLGESSLDASDESSFSPLITRQKHLPATMAEKRKLLAEIDKVFKKIDEGVEIFEETMTKMQEANSENQREKYQDDLKKEIKKLQRLRDQVKNWQNSSEIKDKEKLTYYRKIIEARMEQFKDVERENKTKPHSKQGLCAEEKLDPREKERAEMVEWMSNMIRIMSDEGDKVEALIEQLLSESATNKRRGKQKEDAKKLEKEKELREMLENVKFHQDKLEICMRLVDNESLDPKLLCNVRDELDEWYSYSMSDGEGVDLSLLTEIYEELHLSTLTGPFAKTSSKDEERNDNGSDSFNGRNSPAAGILEEFVKSRHSSADGSSGGGGASLNNAASQVKRSVSVAPPTTSLPPTPLKLISQGSVEAPLASPQSPPTPPPPPGIPYSIAAAARNTVTTTPPTVLSNPAVGAAAQSIGGRSVAIVSQQNSVAAPLVSSAAPLAYSAAPSIPIPLASVAPLVATVNTATKNESFLSSQPSSAPQLIPSRETPVEKESADEGASGLGRRSDASGELAVVSSLSHASAQPHNFAASQPSTRVFNGASPIERAPLIGGAVLNIPADSFPLRPSAVSAIPSDSQPPRPAMVPAPTEPYPLKASQGPLPMDHHPLRAAGLPPMPAESNPFRAAFNVSSPVKNVSSAEEIAMGEELRNVLRLSQQHYSNKSSQPQSAYIPAQLGASPLGRAPPHSDYDVNLACLEQALLRIPLHMDSERPRSYLPKMPCSTITPSFYPQTPPEKADTMDYYLHLTPETLFFTFYYMEGSRAQLLAAKALKKLSWRFHTKYLMWFQRHEEPKQITDDYEEGTYVYFDFEKWSQRKKDNFRFEYRYLEDKELD